MIYLYCTGNSLGGANNKKTMRDKLGASAELSDGEGSEDECKYTTSKTQKYCGQHIYLPLTVPRAPRREVSTTEGAR